MNKNNNVQNDSESLKRSHSKTSNAKLTVLCLFSAIVFSSLWVSLAFINTISKAIIIPVIVVIAFLYFICLQLLKKFTR